MGLTSEYLKFHPVGVFGLVTSSRCPPVYLSSRLVACGCNENVLVWNIATGLRSALLRGESSQVTFIAVRPNTRNELAVGYADGSIGIFNVDQCERLVLLQGHKRSIQTLSFSKSGTQLASGSLDCEIIVWDVVEECGLYRLKGHKDKVTSLEFIRRPNEENESFLISTSSDRTIKIWELATQHCQVTNIHHKAQINAMRIISDLVICASDDPQVRVFKLDWAGESARFDDGSEISLKYFGALNRSGTDKTTFIKIQENMILTHGLKGIVDLWTLNTEEEVKKRTKKRIKKLKRERDADESNRVDENIKLEEINEDTILQDRIKNNHMKPSTFSTSGKLKGFDVFKTKPSEYKVICQHAANQLLLHSLKLDDVITDSKMGKISLPGHRDAPRTVQFSEDNRALVTGSNDSIKVWSVESCKCVRTVATDPITCIEYCRGDRQVIAGAKNGSLLIFDIASAEIVQEVREAHDGEIWQIKKHKGDWATVGTDGNLKLWKLDFKGTV